MVYLFTHVLRFLVNTIIALTIDNYHEQGNTIITILLLPLGHISNTVFTRSRIVPRETAAADGEAAARAFAHGETTRGSRSCAPKDKMLMLFNDHPSWMLEPSRNYSIKSFYKMITFGVVFCVIGDVFG